MKNRRVVLTNVALWASCLLILSCSSNRQIGTLLASFPSETHPVLLFTLDEIPTIRSRITHEPYASWWKWVEKKANEALTVEYTEISLERKKSEYAKSLAFAYVITEDTAYAEKAKIVLASILTHCEGGNWGDIHTEMDAVPNYCQAYDMIAHSLENSPEQHQKIRAKIYALGHRLYSYSSLKETANNWRIRRCAALGLCALAIIDYGEGEEGSNPKDWHASAIKGILRTIDYQTTSDGGHAEGLNYLRYSSDLYIPYLLALHRATGQNLFKTHPFHVLHDWGIKIRLPNGQRPNFDDAALDWYYGGFFARLTYSPSLHQWDWLHAEKRHFCSGHAKIDAICNFDDGIQVQAPDWNPTLFLLEAGNAVFRSDWSSDAIYMLLLGEHSKVRLHGGAHDQPDPMSFIIYAYGEMLAIDSGYIKWKERHKVNKPKNHNLILVDGKGPSAPKWFFGWHGGTDAYLQNCFATGFLDYAEVRTRYRGADFLRHVFFPEHRYFILIDEIRSPEEHQYSWLLHGNGLSGAETFSLTENGGMWTQKGVSLHAYIAAPVGVSISEEQDIHSFDYGQKDNHSLIAAKVKARDTRYVSLLYPRKESDTVPEVSSVTHNGIDGMKLERDDRLELVFAHSGGEIALFPPSPPEYGSLRSDAKISIVSLDRGILDYVAGIDATLCEYNNHVLYASDTKIDITLRHIGEGMDGYVKGEGHYRLELLSDRRPKEISFKNSPVNFQYQNEKIILYLDGEGSISVRGEM